MCILLYTRPGPEPLASLWQLTGWPARDVGVLDVHWTCERRELHVPGELNGPHGPYVPNRPHGPCEAHVHVVNASVAGAHASAFASALYCTGPRVKVAESARTELQHSTQTFAGIVSWLQDARGRLMHLQQLTHRAGALLDAKATGTVD